MPFALSSAGQAGSSPLDGPPTSVEVRLLGAFRLTVDSVETQLPGGAQRLVALLAVHGRHTRSRAAGTLWPEASETRALGCLRIRRSGVANGSLPGSSGPAGRPLRSMPVSNSTAPSWPRPPGPPWSTRTTTPGRPGSTPTCSRTGTRTGCPTNENGCDSCGSTCSRRKPIGLPRPVVSALPSTQRCVPFERTHSGRALTAPSSGFTWPRETRPRPGAPSTGASMFSSANSVSGPSPGTSGLLRPRDRDAIVTAR